MTAKKLSEQNENPRTVSHEAMPVSSPTWHTLAGQWLRSPTAQAHEREDLTRRQAAVQRWRGLPPEAAPCLEGCQP